MSHDMSLPPVKFDAVGTVKPPDGITPEEAERLAREADLARNPPSQSED